MKGMKKMERTHRREIIGIVICIVFLVIFIIIFSNQNLKYMFSSPKEINNIVELSNCEEGDWIKLKFNRAYGTDYWYEENGNKVACFVDIDVNGKAFIAIVEDKKAKEITSGAETDMYLEGIIKKFDDPKMLEGLENIKQNYLEDFSEELTEEEILDMFTPMQFLCYGEEKTNFIVVVVLLMGIIFSLIGIIIAITKILKPVKSKQKRMKKKKYE